MEEKLAQIQLDLTRKILNLRSIERLINLKPFIEAWDSISDEEKKKIEEDILKGNKDELLTWIDKIIKSTENLEVFTIHALRLKAKQLGIPYYYNLCRNELIGQIYAYKHANNQKVSE